MTEKITKEVEMSDDYGKRLLNHYRVQNDVLWQLMMVAQKLCPSGEWVFQIFAHQRTPTDNNPLSGRQFEATFTNGDDNITVLADNPGAAVAKLIYHALDGSVFPLTGNGGRKFFPGDTGWIRVEDSREQP